MSRILDPGYSALSARTPPHVLPAEKFTHDCTKRPYSRCMIGTRDDPSQKVVSILCRNPLQPTSTSCLLPFPASPLQQHAGSTRKALGLHSERGTPCTTNYFRKLAPNLSSPVLLQINIATNIKCCFQAQRRRWTCLEGRGTYEVAFST